MLWDGFKAIAPPQLSEYDFVVHYQDSDQQEETLTINLKTATAKAQTTAMEAFSSHSDPDVILRNLNSHDEEFAIKNSTEKDAHNSTTTMTARVERTKIDPAIQSIQTGQDVAGASEIADGAVLNEFQRHEGVVIVTKLHSEHTFVLLEQSLCLLTQAYNNKMAYPIVVFTTVPIYDQTLVQNLQNIVKPAKLSIVVDNDGLQQEISKLPPLRKQKFFQRCNIPEDNSTGVNDLTWWSVCDERDGKGSKGKLAYNWQAEFRSWHLWNHPALQQYRYMMWIDTDGFCTKVWDRDPIAFLIQHNLNILFDNFPMGRYASNRTELQHRINKVFNKTLCDITLNLKGRFQSKFKTKKGEECYQKSFPLIHGFFHITNLDFFRSAPVSQWGKTLIGDEFLIRRFDDQIAVTVPPAMLSPDKAWDMRSGANITLGIYHNGYLDAKERAGPFKKFWKRTGAFQFPGGNASCQIKVNG